MGEDKKPLDGEIIPPRRKALGRPKGAKDGPKKAEVSRARMTGKMPSTIMLENARVLQGMAAKLQRQIEKMVADAEVLDASDATKAQASEKLKAAKASEKEFRELLLESTECAAKAGPYYEYRLAAMRLSSGPVDLTRLSDEQLDQLLAIHSSLDIEGDGVGREGQTVQ